MKVLSFITQKHNIDVNWLLTSIGYMFIGVTTDKAPEDKEEIERLKAEITALKKSINELEIENKELDKELIQRLKQLLNLQEKLMPSKSV